MSSIAVLKEQEQAQTPLLLFDVTFPDGTLYYWATHSANYNSQDYQARVLRHNFFEIQAMSEQGIDQIPRLTLVLANADSQMSQLNASKGFKGTAVSARFLFYNLLMSAPASDSLVPFTGYFNPPDEINDLELKVTAINRMNLQRVQLPPAKIQRRCPWAFPSNSDERTQAVSDPNSRLYACGYSPDIPGGSGRFESGTAPFTSCTFTRQACITRGMFSQDERTTLAAAVPGGATTILLNDDIADVGETIDIDGNADPTLGFASQEERQVTAKSGTGPFQYTITPALQKAHAAGAKAGRPTRRYGGIEFTPETIDVRPFGSPFFLKSPAQGNPAKYNDHVPMVYGTAWIEPVITVLRNDGNLTRMECLLSLGRIAGVRTVVVNEFEIPAGISGRDMTASGWYNFVNDGNRIGEFDLNFSDRGGNPQGDPYGSQAYLFVAVPNQVNDGKSIPQVRVLLDGRYVETFDAAGDSLGWSFTNNPAWVLLDILKQARWKLGELDLTSFTAAADYADALIPATDNDGNAVTVPRFQCNLLLRQRRPAADVVLGVRNNARLFFTYGMDGRLRLNVENTLAAQQPTKPYGSNATDPLDGGWPAYVYSDSTGTILRRANGASTLRVFHRPISDTPNRLAFEFQDAYNGYVQDAFAINDLEDQAIVGQEISQTLVVDGIPTYDQAARMAKFQLDKSVQGNTFVEFETSVKALGQQVGQIIAISYAKEGWVNRPFRILRLAPQQNYRVVRVTAQAHEDAWYADSNGQAVPPRRRPRQPRLHPRPPNPLAGTVLRADGDFDWDISESRSSDADGAGAVELNVQFAVPVNRFSTRTGPPAVDLTATVSPTGGSLPGGTTLYYAVTSSDGDGEESIPSFSITAQIPEGTNSNSVTVTGLSFDSGAGTFSLYRGTTPTKLFRIVSGQALATTFQDSGVATEPVPLPDPFFARANFYWKFRQTAPVTATVFGPTTIGSSQLSLTPDQFAGRLVRIWEGATGVGQVRTIVTHTADTLTIAPEWVVVPDSTSIFLIEEPDWKSGSSAESTPARFRVPNQKGRALLVQGRAADEQGSESPEGLAVVTAWTIGGVGPGVADIAAPPAPTFGISVPRDGTLVFTPIGFGSLNNTGGISSATYGVNYVGELASTSSVLAGGVSAADTSFTVASSAGFSAGDLVALESETIRIENIQGNTWTVSRGQKGSTAAPHADGATLFRQSTKVFLFPFDLNFFGSPDGASWRAAESLPNARIASMELTVTNAFGDSPTTVQDLLSFNSDAGAAGSLPGLRTNRGGQFLFQVDGILFLESAPTAPLSVHAATSVRDIYAVVAVAPAGAPVTVVLRRNGDQYATVTIPPGETASAAVSGASLAPLQPGDLLTFDIAGVGSTAPGQDLTLVVRL